MRFLDANIFIYAFYTPTGKLKARQREMKTASQEIVRLVNDGAEDVVTTVVHLSEIVNILNRALSFEELSHIVTTFYSLDNMHIEGVSPHDYLGAVELMGELSLDANDALAVQVMRRRGIEQIYSFDRGFEHVRGVQRIP
ncbi:MAG: type II toxin-antitoxin system VapC family toxin [Thermoplasmatota archaeon]